MTKEYTIIRQIYAWVGFVAISVGIGYFLLRVVFVKEIEVTRDQVVEEVVQASETPFPTEGTFMQTIGVISAYTSDPAETDDTPFITASNMTVRKGIVANNCLRFGTSVFIGEKLYQVQDRMNKRYGCNHFDIWMQNKSDAIEYGRQYQMVIILDYGN